MDELVQHFKNVIEEEFDNESIVFILFEKTKEGRCQQIHIEAVKRYYFGKKEEVLFSESISSLDEWKKRFKKDFGFSSAKNSFLGFLDEAKFYCNLVESDPIVKRIDNPTNKVFSKFFSGKDIQFLKFCCFEKNSNFVLINDLCDFYKRVSGLKKISSSFSLYFRGQASNWDLLPSIFRHKEWIDNEAELNEKVISDMVDEFSDCHTHFEKLVRLKHFNQPSRLFDLSSSPLNALFFACDSAKKENSCGIVFTCFSKPELEKLATISDTVSMLTAITRTTDRCKNVVTGKPVARGMLCDASAKPCGRNDCPYLGEMNYQAGRIASVGDWTDFGFSELDEVVVVHPPMNNDRIVRQQGLFLMCGFDINQPYSVPQRMKGFFFRNSGQLSIFIIPQYFIQPILDELDGLGINSFYMFGDLEKKIEHEKNRVVPREEPIRMDKSMNEPVFAFSELINQTMQVESFRKLFTESEKNIYSDFSKPLSDSIYSMDSDTLIFADDLKALSDLKIVVDSNQLVPNGDSIDARQVINCFVDKCSYYPNQKIPLAAISKFIELVDNLNKKNEVKKVQYIFDSIRSMIRNKPQKPEQRGRTLISPGITGY